jgi:hypothetical protein
MRLRARATLYALSRSGRAADNSASAAARKLPAVAGASRRADSAAWARQGREARPPSAIRAPLTMPSSTSSAAATETFAKA